MIIICSEESDISSLKVSKWLKKMKTEHHLLVGENLVGLINKIEISCAGIDVSLLIQDKLILLSSIKAIWFRRGNPMVIIPALKTFDDAGKEFSKIIKKHLKTETTTMMDFFFDQCSEVCTIISEDSEGYYYNTSCGYDPYKATWDNRNEHIQNTNI